VLYKYNLLLLLKKEEEFEREDGERGILLCLKFLFPLLLSFLSFLHLPLECRAVLRVLNKHYQRMDFKS